MSHGSFFSLASFLFMLSTAHSASETSGPEECYASSLFSAIFKLTRIGSVSSPSNFFSIDSAVMMRISCVKASSSAKPSFSSYLLTNLAFFWKVLRFSTKLLGKN